jgi:hypothetical protein
MQSDAKPLSHPSLAWKQIRNIKVLIQGPQRKNRIAGKPDRLCDDQSPRPIALAYAYRPERIPDPSNTEKAGKDE